MLPRRGTMLAGPLDRENILALIQGPQKLIEGYLDLDEQLQVNGLDLTVRDIRRLLSPGAVFRGPKKATLSDSTSIPFDSNGLVHLLPGPYLITVNEIINLPLDMMALARPRSSLLRCGVAIHTAVWDAGYHGRSQALLVVYNVAGYTIARDSRVFQMLFIPLAKPVDEGYMGRYAGENIS